MVRNLYIIQFNAIYHPDVLIGTFFVEISIHRRYNGIKDIALATIKDVLSLDPSRNINYSFLNIEVVVSQILKCIGNNNFYFSYKKLENQEFIKNFGFTEEKRKLILLGLEAYDFCYSTINNKPGYPPDPLYVFCKELTLYDIFDEEKSIILYMKFNLIKNNDGDNFIIIISFHESDRRPRYLFK